MNTNNKLLLVEDDNELRETLEDIFLISGVDYDVAENVAKAEELIALEDLPYHLILSDYLMPGQSGLDFFDKIKAMEMYQRIPFYILTARTEDEIRDKCINAGVSGFIEKPFEMEFLMKLIKKHFD